MYRTFFIKLLKGNNKLLLLNKKTHNIRITLPFEVYQKLQP